MIHMIYLIKYLFCRFQAEKKFQKENRHRHTDKDSKISKFNNTISKYKLFTFLKIPF